MAGLIIPSLLVTSLCLFTMLQACFTLAYMIATKCFIEKIKLNLRTNMMEKSLADTKPLWWTLRRSRIHQNFDPHVQLHKKDKLLCLILVTVTVTKGRAMGASVQCTLFLCAHTFMTGAGAGWRREGEGVRWGEFLTLLLTEYIYVPTVVLAILLVVWCVGGFDMNKWD